MISVNDALDKLLSSFSPVDTEEIPLEKAAGRVLSSDIISEVDLPLFTNSSMDGFALKATDVEGADRTTPKNLKVIEDIPAGKEPTRTLGKGQASRIMTGAPLPDGADAVIPIEDTNQYIPESRRGQDFPGEIEVFRSVDPGAYIREQGEDISTGDTVLKANSQLRPQDLGLLAMLGKSKISVFRRPRIVVFSTGDELVPVEVPLQFGKIHDSNSYTLSAMITQDGGDSVYLGIVSDREVDVREILGEAIKLDADLILSSAGVSVGAFDFVRTVVQSDGSLNFWRVNMRPGKPMAFGHYRDIPFIGLPGNPVSAFVGFEVFVRPIIRKMAGLKYAPRGRIKTKILEEIRSDGRESYLRAVINSQNGELTAQLTGHQGSGNLLSLVRANALLIIPSGVKSLPPGTEVDAWLLNSDWSSS